MSEPSSLAAALSKAQGEFPAIPRNKEVTVQTKTGGKYKFKYATLETIFSATRPALTKHGLAVNHKIRPTEKGHEIVAVLRHEGGETDECALPLNLAGSNQEQGSEITYKRRYAIQCVLGIAADDDDDANGADGNTIENQRETNGKPIARPALTPSPSEKKASEIEAAFLAAKDPTYLAKLGADNKGHIDAMDEGLQARLRKVYGNCMNILSPKKEAA